jgi:hypothetical protein
MKKVGMSKGKGKGKGKSYHSEKSEKGC